MHCLIAMMIQVVKLSRRLHEDSCGFVSRVELVHGVVVELCGVQVFNQVWELLAAHVVLSR